MNRYRNNSLITALWFFLPIFFIALINQSIFYNQSYLGGEYLFIYILLSFYYLLLTIILLKQVEIIRKLFITFVLYKLMIVFILHQLIFKLYDGGDFNGYYFHVVDALIQGEPGFNGFNNVPFIQYLNYYLFQLLPNSLLGLEVLSGLTSFISSLIIYSVLVKYTQNKELLFIILMLIPSVVLFSSFTGKETYALLAFSLFVYIFDSYHYSKKKFRLIIALIFLVIFIGLIRSYHMLIILLSMYFLLMSKGVPSFLANLVLIFIAYFVFYPSIFQFIFGYEYTGMTLSESMNIAYSGGNLMLESLPFPLSLLQSFRPFPWEAHSILSLYVSFESAVALLFIIYAFFKYKWLIVDRIKNNLLYKFLFFYSLISLIIFSFDPNLGDLVRKKVYYFPILLALFIK